jgi:BMFP domain-containing protein YqiC
MTIMEKPWLADAARVIGGALGRAQSLAGRRGDGASGCDSAAVKQRALELPPAGCPDQERVSLPGEAAMQTDNRILDDLARVAAGAFNAMSGLKDEFELKLREQFERILARMDLVKREEFEAVKAVAVKAREEQEALQARLDALEARLGPAEPSRRRPAK